MYDTVNLWVDGSKVNGINFSSVVPKYLDKVTESCQEDRKWVSGTIKGYKVYISESGVSIKGSLPKFYLGDNFQTLTRGDTKRAFEMLSDTIHLPVENAKVTRFDIANNLILKYPVESYFQHLGVCQNYKRFLQSNSLYYSNRIRTKLFYNKVVEGKAKGYEIPKIWANTNVLRYELRYAKRLPFQFKKLTLTASDLIDEDFYIDLINRWVYEFDIISKINRIIINLNIMESPTPKDFLNQLLIQSINEIGQSEIFAMIDNLKSTNTFSKPEYYSRLKNSIKKLSSTSNLSVQSELIDEMTKKVKSIGKYCR